MTRFDLVIFDWDGTLMDSTGAIAASIEAACRDLGLPAPAGNASTWVIGLGLVDALSRIAPTLPKERVGELVERYRHHYLARDHALTLFPGVMGMLGDLQGRAAKRAVATGKSRIGLERAFEVSRTRSLFHASRCADETASKPSPRMVHELCRELHVPPERAIIVGDTIHDVQMARNAGSQCVAVSYGAHDVPTLHAEQPYAVVHSVSELRDWLLESLA